MTRTYTAGLLLLLLAVASGCPESKPPAAPPQTTAPASVTLRIGVVNDEPLATAIGRLSGEWSERSGGDYELVAITTVSEVEAIESCDVVIFASGDLGELCEADRLRPVRSSVLESEEVAFSDFFPLVRDVEIVYGGVTMALPIGCPCPLVYRADNVPEMYFDRVDIGAADDVGIATTFLAVAAARAVHASQSATLWDSDSFKPRLAEPPFVDALASIVQLSGLSAESVVLPNREATSGGSGVVKPMPTAEVIYNPLGGNWEKGPDRPTTLLASSGRLVGVTSASRNAASAFRFVGWLVSPAVGRQLMTSSRAVTNCRGSLVPQPDDWFRGDTRSPLAGSFPAALSEALRTDRYLISPRLPARRRYLAALGQAIKPVFPFSRGDQPALSPEGALRAAAARWEAISEELGREAQHEAYLRSLNLRRYEPARR